MNTHCRRCGCRELAEFFEPVGLVICTSCGALFRRSSSDPVLAAGIRNTPDAQLRVRELIAAHAGVDVSVVTPDVNLETDLGMDSLDIVELLMALEEEGLGGTQWSSSA